MTLDEIEKRFDPRDASMKDIEWLIDRCRKLEKVADAAKPVTVNIHLIYEDSDNVLEPLAEAIKDLEDI